MKLKKFIKEMESTLQTAKQNAEAFLGGNNSASTRLRKDFKQLMDLGKNGRKKVIDIRNKRKEKKKK